MRLFYIWVSTIAVSNVLLAAETPAYADAGNGFSTIASQLVSQLGAVGAIIVLAWVVVTRVIPAVAARYDETLRQAIAEAKEAREEASAAFLRVLDRHDMLLEKHNASLKEAFAESKKSRDDFREELQRTTAAYDRCAEENRKVVQDLANTVRELLVHCHSTIKSRLTGG